MDKTSHPQYLLFIEPKKSEKLINPIVDEWVTLLKLAFRKVKIGVYAEHRNAPAEFIEKGFYRGVHTTECGEMSRNYDYLLENGMITNSLCKFYLIWYRNSIPESEWEKLRKLADFYNFDTSLFTNGSSQ